MLSMNDERRTLLFLLKDNEILLAVKKRGFGEGLWNGVGGKIESGETIEQALVRECQEEIEVTPVSYSQVAELDFYGGTKAEPWHLQIFAYFCNNWQGEPVETEEMAPKWYKLTDLPYAYMWDDDKYWLPLVLKGKKLKANFNFNENNTVVSNNILEVSSL